MNQISRIPSSSVCYYHTFRNCDKSFICSRCLGHHKYFAVDHLCYSTYESLLLKHKVKNKKDISSYEKKLKETQLLKVTNKEATEKTMTVAKLNASLVTAFAKEPGMILNNTKDLRYNKEVEKKRLFSAVSQKEQSSNNVGNSSSFNEVYKGGVRSSVNTEDPKKLYNFVANDHHSSIHSNFSEKEFKKTHNSAILPNNSLYNFEMVKNLNEKKTNQKIEKDAKKEIYKTEAKELQFEQDFSKALENISVNPLKSKLDTFFHVKNFTFDDFDKNDYMVLSTIDVCVNNGMLQNAYDILLKHGAKNTNNALSYDLVLKGYAEKGDWTQVQNIFRLMEVRNVQRSCSSFALSLDCLYRTSEREENKKRKAKKILSSFQSMGYGINDLFSKTRINFYKRENILKIVHWFFPNFVPHSPSFSSQNQCRLVADLYDKNYVVKSPHPFFTPNKMAEAVEEQLTLETKSFCEVESVVNRGICRPEHKENWLNLIEVWKKNIRINFTRLLNALREEVKERSHSLNLYPFLSCLPVEDFVNVMLHEINNLCLNSEGYSCNTTIIKKNIGTKVYNMFCVKKKIRNNELMGKYKDFINMYMSWYINPDGDAKSAREKWLMMMWYNPDIMTMGERSLTWPDVVKNKVGDFLMDIILKSAVLPTSYMSSSGEGKPIPAFYLVLRKTATGGLSEQLKSHPTLRLLYQKANLNTLFFDVDQLPMFCPPKPWTSIDSGGFYILPTHFLRPTQFNYNMRVLRSACSQNLSTIFDSLNQLQSIPWKVNEKILDIILEIFRKGGSKELNVPFYPDLSSLPEPQDFLNLKAKTAAYKERLKLVQQRQADFGLWCEGLYKLSLANHLRKKTFWLPHNMDFRGRVYPVPPHISHITADLYRSLFLFAKQERLGEKGLDWLKIHAINLTGTFSKKPISERLKHANEILDDILDSAENPLTGRKWWTESEEPWQTLAACFEIRNALLSKNPQNYRTGFPVHQDGSCNGLQHYAALGRDVIGAASVNLKPSSKPEDVYTAVANIIEEIRKKDVEKGIEIASVLEGFITRKIVKQTVMTTVYGVTFYGAKLQIKNRLEETPNFPSERILQAATYLSTKVFEALREMFTSAREIQNWFLKCATIITGPYNSSVSWITPLGLPVVQPYFKSDNFRRNNLDLSPDKRKQKNAFPPNFIHSLDSSHMMLTALYCGKAGLCFASVHDCFWTHPCNVDIMNKICREKFIALHSEEILNDLADHFVKTYQNQKPNNALDPTLVDVPKRGDFDLKSIMNSVYFFS